MYIFDLLRFGHIEYKGFLWHCSLRSSNYITEKMRALEIIGTEDCIDIRFIYKFI